MLAEWARAALVSLALTHKTLRSRLLRLWLCRRRVRFSFHLSFIVWPPQVLTAVVAAPARAGSTAEAENTVVPAKSTTPRTAAACLITIKEPPPLLARCTLAQR